MPGGAETLPGEFGLPQLYRGNDYCLTQTTQSYAFDIKFLRPVLAKSAVISFPIYIILRIGPVLYIFFQQGVVSHSLFANRAAK